MPKCRFLTLTSLALAAVASLCGCVERRLTINTRPQGALVLLNDEEIGRSPVTVTFNWYGDYAVRATREGFQTLNTHRELKAPWYDQFPFDFFAQIVSPARTVDSYEWTFDLEPLRPPTRAELIKKSQKLKEQLE
ncbi:MAG: PEGA domain-containing protein [Phycisphaerales bacterium]|nr:MAG: PEGA domain-containing protein [Phycisphaerales bacterium]